LTHPEFPLYDFPKNARCSVSRYFLNAQDLIAPGAARPSWTTIGHRLRSRCLAGLALPRSAVLRAGEIAQSGSVSSARVYSKELIHTGDADRADLRFHDNSNLSVGPKSNVRLDKFVYDPNKSASSVAVEATRGSFRFVTGSQSKGSYQVKTPYGTLGIRG
jgi:hypothetical protein